MKCPYCGKNNSKVIDSRPTDDNSSIRRRRECLECNNRFTTYETVEDMPILVVKKNGTREVFSRSKVLKGIASACESRQITSESMDRIADTVERKINDLMAREIDSNAIGEIVMDGLKELDEVAYVRFASVYKNFKDIDTFMAELESLMKEKGEEKMQRLEKEKKGTR